MALDFLHEVGKYLASQGLGTINNDITIAIQPPDVNNCISLFGLTGINIAAQRDVPGLQFPRFQAIVRNVDYNDAADKFQGLRTALHGKIGLILPVGVNTAVDPYIRVMRCHAEQEGGPIGQDPQGRFEFSINFIAEYHHYDPTP